MRVQLSGGLQVVDDDRVLELGPAKSQAVFVALALNAGRSVPVARIVELVWGEDPPRTAEKTLQSHVTRLRSALDGDLIDRIGDAYRLKLDPTAVDLVEFERLLDTNSDDGRTAALALWNGDPLLGVATPAMEPIVTRLNDRFLAATELEIQATISQGRAESVVPELQQLTSAHPLRERLWGLLMTALYATGRQADALRAYADARDHLVQGLGIDPGHELQAIERRILEADPALGATDSAQQPQGASTGLVGEEVDVTILYTDIVDSTGLWDRHGAAMATALARHDETVRSHVGRFGGTLFKHTGDGGLSAFARAVDAVQAATDAQIALQGLTVGDESLIVKMAVASGRATPRGDDWFGAPLNIGARLLEAAHPGQILLSAGTARALEEASEASVAMRDLGLVPLRGLSRPERICQVLNDALLQDFGPLRSAGATTNRAYLRFPPQLEYAHAVPFIGRDDHTQALAAAWDRSKTGNRPGFVLLGGEPGVGKTRLAANAARTIHDEDHALIVYGRCVEDHPAPFRPFAEALTSYCLTQSDADLRSQTAAETETIAVAVPHLASRFPDVKRPEIGVVDALDVFDAITDFVELAARDPLVLVIDDVQWADRSSLDLLRQLARSATSGRLLVIVTYRDGEVGRSHPAAATLSELRRSDDVVTLPVGAIDASEAVAMTEAVLGHELTSTGRQLAIGAGNDVGGNPFFLQEMLRHFMETGVLHREEGRWSADNVADLEASVPMGIREMVGQRLDQLSESGNSLLRTASAFDGDIDVDLLIAVSGSDENEVLDLLDEAMQIGVLADASTPGRYAFSHALIRQTLYQEFSSARRLRLHRKIGDALVADGDTDDATVGAIARHYLAASTAADPDVVAHWTRKAAQDALERTAFEEAASLLVTALDVVEGEIPVDTEIELRSTLTAAQGLFDVEASNRSLIEVASLAERASSKATARAAITISRWVVSFSMLGESSEVLRRLLNNIAIDDVDASTQAAITVERLAHANADVDDLIDRLDVMDAQTLTRVISATSRAVMTRSQLVQLRASVEHQLERLAGHVPADTIDRFNEMVGTILWEQTEPRQMSTEARIRGRTEGQEALNRLIWFVRRGELEQANQEAVRLQNVLPPIWLEAHRRWTAYECDELQPGEPWIAELSGAAGRLLQTPFGLLQFNRVADLDAAFVTRLAATHHDVGALLTLSQAAFAVQAAELADDLLSRIAPSTGLATFFTGMTEVTAIDYSLGLLQTLRGEHDLAIELQHSALQTVNQAGMILDSGYCTLQLVRLLRERAAADDLSEAADLIEEALSGLRAAGYIRLVSLLEAERALLSA